MAESTAEYDDSEPELIEPEDFLPDSPFPADAQRLGIDRWTADGGALIGFAAALDGRKASHRAMAWLMLLVVGLPVVFDVLRILG